MRLLLQLLIALTFVAGGIVFGAFNPQAVTVDFHLVQVDASLGVAILFALFFGALLGGIAVVIGLVWPLRRRLRKTVASRSTSAATPPGSSNPA